MSWTAIVPLNAAGERKTRLAGRLDAAARDRLSERMLAHVAAALAGTPRVRRTLLLARERPALWSAAWIRDGGTGLNAELDAARERLGNGRLLVLHADLPLLAAADIGTLLDAAEAEGAAIAPDRHERGTNALALCDGRTLAFAFGPDSFAEHRRRLGGSAVVGRNGLAFDLDTEDDLDSIGTLAILAEAPSG